MKKQKLNTVTTFSLTAAMFARLKRAAKARKVSVSAVIREAIAEKLATAK